MASVKITVTVNNHTYTVERDCFDMPGAEDLDIVKPQLDRAVGQIGAAMGADQWRE